LAAHLTEGKKISRKHLCTLEPSISKDQTDEIASHSVQLVIPEAFHQTYTDDQKPSLWTISAFIDFVREKQR
jgi:EcoRII C terminal